MKPHEKYVDQLNELNERIQSDFEYYRNINSQIDKRLNELGKRGNIEETADEMRMLLEDRARVKDISLKLLPLRDFFRNNYEEVGDRLARLAEFDRK
ncbi:hypothetical protein MHZ92_20035 [Sporosarcina sp. ACRSL]|uniref:hypothetical protein n=1 Tax=Sporosarcina sp. ACRSL TaxID=2918215 RepID=UPI001EF6F5B0|nr:hypothetical protein [Sporosarcina sp. ACRSL]MCG7346399.1 hypothetical protein [Sporosarcina sp. ACRSL]